MQSETSQEQIAAISTRCDAPDAAECFLRSASQALSEATTNLHEAESGLKQCSLKEAVDSIWMHLGSF